jgi:hypothetical protein
VGHVTRMEVERKVYKVLWGERLPGGGGGASTGSVLVQVACSYKCHDEPWGSISMEVLSYGVVRSIHYYLVYKESHALQPFSDLLCASIRVLIIPVLSAKVLWQIPAKTPIAK